MYCIFIELGPFLDQSSEDSTQNEDYKVNEIDPEIKSVKKIF